MTYKLNPRLFLENGAAAAAAAALQLHHRAALRIALTAVTGSAPVAPATPKADNDSSVSECGIRFAL